MLQLFLSRSGEDEKRRGGSDGVLVDEEGMSFGRWQEANEMKTRQRGDEDHTGDGEEEKRRHLVFLVDTTPCALTIHICCWVSSFGSLVYIDVGLIAFDLATLERLFVNSIAYANL
ncbi:hypothetical protein QVD17_30841 [Tagetes erecta]|uniref:Uncharacterized protein n=1 Tax=Tagetes erecta TaxID=13708 RepID=A0AAD8K519_TARER|nr:hypothetical protein QVD17_30841 [Tagetes erecta]